MTLEETTVECCHIRSLFLSCEKSVRTGILVAYHRLHATETQTTQSQCLKGQLDMVEESLQSTLRLHVFTIFGPASSQPVFLAYERIEFEGFFCAQSLARK